MVVQSKPITPEKVQEKFLINIPDIIIDVVNDLIVKNWDPSSKEAVVEQEEIVSTVLKKTSTIRRDEIFNRNWLDFEDLYRQNGWDVEYDKPAYCETYEPTFTFKKKKKGSKNNPLNDSFLL